jgi:hypothetical protein
MLFFSLLSWDLTKMGLGEGSHSMMERWSMWMGNRTDVATIYNTSASEHNDTRGLKSSFFPNSGCISQSGFWISSTIQICSGRKEETPRDRLKVKRLDGTQERFVSVASSLGKEAMGSMVAMEVLADRTGWEQNWSGCEFCLRLTHMVTG